MTKTHEKKQSSVFSLLLATSHEHSTATGPSDCFKGDRNTAEQTPVRESKPGRSFRPFSDIIKGHQMHVIVRETMMKETLNKQWDLEHNTTFPLTAELGNASQSM